MNYITNLTLHPYFVHCSIGGKRKKNSLNIAIQNVELKLECCPQQQRNLTARMKEDEEPEKEGKRRRHIVETSKAETN